jgi:hypothetical protein
LANNLQEFCELLRSGHRNISFWQFNLVERIDGGKTEPRAIAARRGVGKCTSARQDSVPTQISLDSREAESAPIDDPNAEAEVVSVAALNPPGLVERATHCSHRVQPCIREPYRCASQHVASLTQKRNELAKFDGWGYN